MRLRLVADPVEEEIFENERYQPFRGWGHQWPGHFLPTDRVGHWSTNASLLNPTLDSASFDAIAPQLREARAPLHYLPSHELKFCTKKKTWCCSCLEWYVQQEKADRCMSCVCKAVLKTCMCREVSRMMQLERTD